MSPKIAEKNLELFTDIITANACIKLGWHNYAKSIYKYDYLIYVPPDIITNKAAKKRGDKLRAKRLYTDAIKAYEKANDVLSLCAMGKEKLSRGYLETSREAFKAAARVLLRQTQ